MDLKKKLVIPKYTGNKVYFPGTDEAGDIFHISAKCWPRAGVHAGISKWVGGNIEEVKSHLDPDKPIELRGYSMGGNIAIEVGSWFARKGYLVHCKVYGPYKMYRKKVTLPDKMILVIYENGNDPITSFFPWFKHLVNPIHIGDKRVWYKVVFHFFLFLIGKGDHTKYKEVLNGQ